MDSFAEWLKAEMDRRHVGLERFSRDYLGGEPSHQTVKNIIAGAKDPKFMTVELLIDKLSENEDERHRAVHILHRLPPPNQIGELEGDLKELCDLVMSMTEDERANLLASVKKYIDSKDNLFSFDKAAEPKSKYRGGDTLQAPPVAKAGGG